MNHFPAAVIPSESLRRSFVLHRLEFFRAGTLLLDILEKIAPREAAKCYLGTLSDAMDVYQKLCGSMWQMFPMYDPYDDADTMDDILSFGIPISVLGYLPYENPSVSLAVLLLTIHSGYDESLFDCALINTKWNADKWWSGPVYDFTPVHPPRGRTWRGVWSALPDTIDYVLNQTGYAFLDMTTEDEVENPRWHIDEIRSCAKQWKAADPIYDRIYKFVTYLDADPKRLRLLDAVLRRDEKALIQVTQPKHQATLAEIFSK